MSIVDLALVALLVLSIVGGYRRGAVMQVATLTGMAIGFVAGALLAPHVASLASDPWAKVGLALGTLLVLGAGGNAMGAFVGHRMRARTHGDGGSLQRADRVGGSFLSVVALVVVTWFLALNFVEGPFPLVAREIRDSRVVRAIDAMLPAPPSLVGELRGVLDLLGFPDVFVGIPPAPADPVPPPSTAQARAAFRAVARQTVEIVDPACDGILQGTGFVVGFELVLTNAHVVAGGRAPEVVLRDGRSRLDAYPVLFDPELDIAILRVPGLAVPPVEMIWWLVDRGKVGAVVGYPGGDPLTGVRAAVRRSLEALGRDIYGEGTVQRHVYELQTQVRPGNSGGPFVMADGRVAGVVFANSTTDPGTGYAIASKEVVPLVERAEARLEEVSVGACVG